MKQLIPITLTNATAMLVLTGHPWIFRNKFSRYEKELQDGDWILLLGSGNKELGVGIYAKTGLIAVRIFYFGEGFNLSILQNKISKRLEKRIPLLNYTDSIRWIHGENDNLPGVTVDGHGSCLIIMYYSSSLEIFARYISKFVYSQLLKYEKIKTKPDLVILSSPNRKGFDSNHFTPRIFRGNKAEKIQIKYRHLNYFIDPFGQKSGIYNDIRNLRNYILENSQIITNQKILNLFSSNGLLSICLEEAGANFVVSVEDSRRAIAVHELNLQFRNKKINIIDLISNSEFQFSNFAKQNDIQLDKQRIIKADLFKELLPTLKRVNIKFDTIIIDPPSLTASEKDKVTAREIYKRLISESLNFLKENGSLILCSCSNRIHPNDFERICKEAITESGKKVKNPIRLQNEIDHPTLSTFPEGNYFKAHIYHDISSI